MKETKISMEKRENEADDRILKEVLSEYAEQELRQFGQEPGGDEAKPGACLNGRMKRAFWYYGGGRKKIAAVCGTCAALAAAAGLGFGMGSAKSGRGQDQRNGGNIARTETVAQDADNLQYEVYMNHYGETASISYANAQNQRGTDGALPEEISALQAAEWSGLSVHTNAETAVRNSNYKNFGYLCSDGLGKIYYSDLAERAIYMSGEDGSGRVKLTDGAGNYLQERDGNLYYTALDEDGVIMRLNIATGAKTVLMDEPHGEFILTDEGLLVNAERGVLLLGYEGGEAQKVEAMSDKEWTPALFTASDDMVIFNAVQGTNVNYYLQGYLLCYNKNKEEVTYLGQVMMRPLLAGNYLIAIKGESMKQASLHVMDMAAGTDTDLGVWPYDGFVSDGNAVYYTRGSMLGRFQDGENEEIMDLRVQESERMGQAPTRYLYLTEDYLYWLSERQIIEGGEVIEVYYEWHSVKITD